MAWTELVERRTAKAKVYSDGAGHFRAEQTLHDQHYQDASGVWQEVNEALETDGVDGFSVKAGRMRHLIRGKDDGTRRWYPRRNVLTEYVQFGIPQYWTGTTWATLTLGTPVREGNTLTWDQPSYALKVTANWHNLKLDVTLKTSAAARRIRWPISLTGLTRSGWNLLSGSTVVGHIDAPTAEDAEGTPFAVTASVVSGRVVFDANLSGAVFPVVIDPTLTVQPDAAAGQETHIAGDYPNNAYGSDYYTTHKVGKEQYGEGPFRMLIKFAVADVPEGATCDSATMTLYQTSEQAANTRTFRVYRMIRAWTESATWNTYDGTNNWGTAGAANTTSDRESSEIGSLSLADDAANGAKDWTLDAESVQDWWDGGLTNNGLLIQADTENDDCHTFASNSNSTASYRPKLVIEYTEAAAGQPSQLRGFAVPHMGRQWAPRRS